MAEGGTPHQESDATEEQVYADTRQPAPPPKEFLESAALSEMLGAMPSYLARGLTYLLVLIVFAAVGYAYFGKMDVVVSAQGGLMPQGDAVVVQSLKSGPLAALPVREGDRVKAGQVLAQLDLTQSNIEAAKQQTDYERHKRERDCARVSLVILREALAGKRLRLDEREVLKTCSGDEADVLVGLKQAEMQYEQASLAARAVDPMGLETLLAAAKNKEETLAFKRSQLRDAQADLGRATSQWETYQEMHRRGLASKIKLLEEQKRYEDAVAKVKEAELGIRTGEMELHDAKLKVETTRAQNALKNEQAAQVYDLAVLKYRAVVNAMELKHRQAEMALANMALDSRLQEYSRRLDVIRAPVEGMVVGVGARAVGELVKAGSVLFTINPSDRPLVGRIQVPNKDVGRVKVGLRAKLKVDAFPYQNYGVVHGKVVEISPDAKPVKGGSVYEATIALDRDFVTKGKERFALFSGLSLTAEIVVERMRIIEVFLEPFKKLKQG